MVRFLLPLALAAWAAGADAAYDITGHFAPEARASVSLSAVKSPFTTTTLSDEAGRFSFKAVAAGAYTVAVYIPSRGEARVTVEVGPGTADSQGRIRLTLSFKESDFQLETARRQHSVSADELAIPASALREFAEAEKALRKPDTESARLRLERAVKMAPRFAAAWNELGTLAYKEHSLARAEECFRAALEADPESFEPLVNLGGVLLNLGKYDEAIDRNVHAVLARPNDALANAQLGMTYFYLNRFDLARKHLEEARRLDPSHFSHPQLFLAEIDLRLGDRRAAAADLEDFLDHHPDYPQTAKVREKIAELRK
jgi:tetratricopeptide (TPR) repeat protein